MSKVKITIVTFEEFTDIDFRAPTAYYIRNALGEYVYFHTRDRLEAQKICDETYGKSK
jgi:hypothetical protein